eukprot:10729967-Alexandrium_andersonii.AAC.1
MAARRPPALKPRQAQVTQGLACKAREGALRRCRALNVRSLPCVLRGTLVAPLSSCVVRADAPPR